MELPIKIIPFEVVRAFAAKRSKGLSLSFLKENGEFLSIALSSGLSIGHKSLALYDNLHDKIDKLCELYPPFFRFFLAIALDLEDLGMPGNKGTELIDFVLKNDLYAYETSDTRRMEIINLLARRGRSPSFETDSRASLDKRVTGFMERPERFIKFNRPLFYELTHLIFFSTNFGKTKISHTEKLFESLKHIGMLAYLDGDHDLLSEVCLCFIFLGEDAPKIWEEYCRNGQDMMTIKFHTDSKFSGASPADDYHIYLVSNWLMAHIKAPVFTEIYQDAVPEFVQNVEKKSTLSKIFKSLHPMVLENEKGRSKKTLNISAILSAEDTVHLETAFSAYPQSHEFLEKLSNGRILFN